MAETDDPWANHIRGTPIAEGADPLSGGVSPTNGTTTLVTSPLPKTIIRDELFAADNAEERQGEMNGAPVVPAADNVNDTASDLESASIRSPLPKAQDMANEEHSDLTSGSGHYEVPEDETNDSEEDDDEPFVYPGASISADASSASPPPPGSPEHVVTEVAHPTEQELADVQPADTTLVPPASVEADDVVADAEVDEPVDYARLCQLCSQGPLTALQSFFSTTTSPAPVGSGVSAFALANEPSPSTGLAPVHFAAREGRVDVLKWLVREAGALVEMEDREGETALHKASMAGKLPALSFLIASGASANSIDGDGWTPLHNACSKGYLDIVKVLIENAGASIDVKGGRGGWTPLMNAASNGHLPIVRYLTTKRHIDPFVRNAAGETAYDVAAATFEIFICELLEQYESERWAALKFSSAGTASTDDSTKRIVLGKGPYNPLALHTTVPVILHENQRLDTRLSTLAVRGGKPRWSGTQAGRPDKNDRRAPGTMPPGPLALSRTRHLPMARNDVKVPTRAQPYKLQLPNRSAQIAAAKRQRGDLAAGREEELGSTPTPDSVMQQQQRSRQTSTASTDASATESSHFWLSDWQNDFTHPQVDAEQGWQYSQAFDTPDERWLASEPAPLARLLEGRGLGASVQRAMSGALLASTGAAPSPAEAEAVSTGWVRRRRWVRVMRRRLDIAFCDGLEAVEQESLDAMTAAQNVEVNALSHVQQEAQRAADQLGPGADYMARSKAMAGSAVGSTPADMSAAALQDRIARIEMAVFELRQHAFDDTDARRQQSAEELLKEFTLQLGQLRQAAGLDEESEEEDDDSDEEFIYPNSYKDGGQSVITRIGGPSTAPSAPRPPITARQSSTPSTVFGERAAPSEAGTTLGALRSADLANAREFRVPTHEVPQRSVAVGSSAGRGSSGLREHNVVPVWEHDADAATCRGCNRKFTFFLRKHHCRRCGRIFCDPCSSHRAHLSPDELVIDPGVPEMMLLESHGPTRICDACDAERRLPPSLRGARSVDAVSNAVDGWDAQESGARQSMSDVSSHASELTECPVCGSNLAGFGDEAAQQEEHVRLCLESGGGGSVQGGRYLVYKLGEGPIVGKECQICLEDLLVGMTVARLPCLCYYHRHCIDAWFSRGRCCPVHARTW